MTFCSSHGHKKIIPSHWELKQCGLIVSRVLHSRELTTLPSIDKLFYHGDFNRCLCEIREQWKKSDCPTAALRGKLCCVEGVAHTG